MRIAVAAVACSALSLSACWAEEPKKSEASNPAPATAEAPAAKPVQVAADTPAEKPADKPAEAAPAAAAPAADKPAEAAPAAAAAAPAADAAASGAADPVAELAKSIDGVTFKDGRYRTKEGQPTPVVTKDYKVDWATWQGFRRYHDACHVCHGPNALGSSFAPGLAESLKTMDYETFYGTVVGGKIREAGGTTYVMPAFGEDKNIMCYLDDIYTYIKARSVFEEGKGGMPAGRPNGREDISEVAKKAASDCTDAK
jgi:methanol metabolism-related c-type cytochrome